MGITLTVGRWLDRHAGILLGLPALTVLLVFAFYPVAGSVWLSLHRVILSLPGAGEPFVGLQNYVELATSPVFRHSLGVTLLFVVGSTALELVLGIGLALCLHASYPGRGVVRGYTGHGIGRALHEDPIVPNHGRPGRDRRRIRSRVRNR